MPDNVAECFWLVWNKDGGVPTRKHPSEASARNEAVRLAIANPGKRFVVLRSIGEAFQPPAVMWTKHDEIPF